jgi:FkbM family methyltransferase
MVKARLNGLYDIVLPKHRADRPQWHSEQGWEKERLAALRAEIIRQRSVGREPVVYYIGAEEGEMAALCQIWGAEVALFEPNPKVWPNIKAIWEANGLEEPLGIYVGFASNSTEESPTELDYDDSARAGWPECAYGPVIGDHGFRELAYEAAHTRQIRIDDFLMRRSLRPTVISIDVEGSEWQVLRGAERLLDDHHPTIFLSGHPEFMFHMFGEYLGDLRRWLKDKGYREQLLAYEHEVHLLYETKS